MTPEQRRKMEVIAIVRMVRLGCYARGDEIQDPVLKEVVAMSLEQEAGAATPERERRCLGVVMDRLSKREE
jgi:hypothetical protein